MSDKDFDALFARKFEQSLRPKSGNWEDMSNRLNVRDSRRRWLIGGFLSGILLLLLGSNIFLWSKWQSASHSSNGSKPIIELRDTIVHTTTIYKFDTIYKKTILVQEAKGFSKNKTGFTQIPPPQYFDSKILKNKTGYINLINDNSKLDNNDLNKNSLSNNNAKLDNNDLSNNNAKLDNNDLSKDNLINDNAKLDNNGLNKNNLINDNAKLYNNDLVKTDSINNHVDNNDLNNKKPIILPIRNPLFSFRHPKLGLEIDYGSLSPKDFQYSWVAGAGLSSEIDITKRFILRGSVSYLFTHLQATTTNTSILQNSDISYPGANYEFETWSISKLPALRYSAGLQFSIGKPRWWQSYIVVGANGATVFAHEVKIDFKEKDKPEKKEVKHKETKQKTELNALYGGIGLNWQFSRRWLLQTEALYAQNLSKKYDWITPQYALKTRLLFEF